MEYSDLTDEQQAVCRRYYQRGWYAAKKRYLGSATCKWCGRRTDGEVYHQLCLEKKQIMLQSKSVDD